MAGELLGLSFGTYDGMVKDLKKNYRLVPDQNAKLKGYKVKHIQPTPHWLFKDRLLSEIYDETYPFEE